MQSAYLIPAEAIAEPEPPPGFPEDPQAARTRAQLTTARATGRAGRGVAQGTLNGLYRIADNSNVTPQALTARSTPAREWIHPFASPRHRGSTPASGHQRGAARLTAAPRQASGRERALVLLVSVQSSHAAGVTASGVTRLCVLDLGPWLPCRRLSGARAAAGPRRAANCRGRGSEGQAGGGPPRPDVRGHRTTSSLTSCTFHTRGPRSIAMSSPAANNQPTWRGTSQRATSDGLVEREPDVEVVRRSGVDARLLR